MSWPGVRGRSVRWLGLTSLFFGVPLAFGFELPQCQTRDLGFRVCQLCRTAPDPHGGRGLEFWVFGPWRNQKEADRALSCLEGVLGTDGVRVRFRSQGYELLVPWRGDREIAWESCPELQKPIGPVLVTSFDLPGSSSELELFWLELDLRRFRIEAHHALDTAVGLETTRSLVRRHGALAGLNGGFFSTSGTVKGESAGLWIHRARLLSEPDRGRGAVGFEDRGSWQRVHFGRPQAELWGWIGSQRFPLSGVNRKRGAEEAVLYTPEFHRTTLTDPGGTEVVVREGEIVAVQHGVGSQPIPESGFVFSFGPAWRLEGLPQSGTASWSFELSGWRDSPVRGVEEAVSAGPWLLSSGRSVLEPERESISRVFSLARHPRTAVGVRHDGTLLLLVADGRAPGRSAGLSLPELQEVLLELGVTDAVNLDGGGSSTLVVRDLVLNQPSDSTGERENGDALLVFRSGVARVDLRELDTARSEPD